MTLRLDEAMTIKIEGLDVRTGGQPFSSFTGLGFEYDPVTAEPGNRPFAHVGVVGPGEYRIFAQSEAGLDGFQGASANLKVTIRGTVIPTPAAAGMGLLMLGGAALRRR